MGRFRKAVHGDNVGSAGWKAGRYIEVQYEGELGMTLFARLRGSD